MKLRCRIFGHKTTLTVGVDVAPYMGGRSIVVLVKCRRNGCSFTKTETLA